MQRTVRDGCNSVSFFKDFASIYWVRDDILATIDRNWPFGFYVAEVNNCQSTQRQHFDQTYTGSQVILAIAATMLVKQYRLPEAAGNRGVFSVRLQIPVSAHTAFIIVMAQIFSMAPVAAAELADSVQSRFSAIFEGRCATAGTDSHIEPQAPEVHQIRFKNEGESDGSEQVMTLFVFLCDRGAYNETHVFMSVNEYDEIQPVQFAEPLLKIEYENDDFEAAVMAIEVRGMTATDMLTNAFYDTSSRSITSHSKWRGLGDASSTGLWQFSEGRFFLKRYEVDASYDGEITPQAIVDYASQR